MLFLSLIFRLLLHSLLSLLSLLIIVGLSLIWHRLIAAWHPLSQSAPSILCVRLFRVILVLCWWLNARWLLLLLLSAETYRAASTHVGQPLLASHSLLCLCVFVLCRVGLWVGRVGWVGVGARAQRGGGRSCSTRWRAQRGGVLNVVAATRRSSFHAAFISTPLPDALALRALRALRAPQLGADGTAALTR